MKMVQPISGNSYVAQLVAQANNPASSNSSSSSSTSSASQTIQDTLSLSAAGLKASGGGDRDGDGH
jgi:hypothetical protein